MEAPLRLTSQSHSTPEKSDITHEVSLGHRALTSDTRIHIEEEKAFGQKLIWGSRRMGL